MRAWLRRWLGIGELLELFHREITKVREETFRAIAALVERNDKLEEAIHLLQSEVRELRAEVTRLQIAQYVPPSQPEPERKVIRTQTFKQFTDILEREQETSDAV